MVILLQKHFSEWKPYIAKSLSPAKVEIEIFINKTFWKWMHILNMWNSATFLNWHLISTFTTQTFWNQRGDGQTLQTTMDRCFWQNKNIIQHSKTNETDYSKIRSEIKSLMRLGGYPEIPTMSHMWLYLKYVYLQPTWAGNTPRE